MVVRPVCQYCQPARPARPGGPLAWLVGMSVCSQPAWPARPGGRPVWLVGLFACTAAAFQRTWVRINANLASGLPVWLVCQSVSTASQPWQAGQAGPRCGWSACLSRAASRGRWACLSVQPSSLASQARWTPGVVGRHVFLHSQPAWPALPARPGRLPVWLIGLFACTAG